MEDLPGLIQTDTVTKAMLRHFFKPGSIVSIASCWYKVANFTVFIDIEGKESWSSRLCTCNSDGTEVDKVRAIIQFCTPTYEDFLATHCRIHAFIAMKPEIGRLRSKEPNLILPNKE